MHLCTFPSIHKIMVKAAGSRFYMIYFFLSQAIRLDSIVTFFISSIFSDKHLAFLNVLHSFSDQKYRDGTIKNTVQEL